MIERTIHVRETRERIVASLSKIALEARAGSHIAQSILNKCGIAILRRIHQAFLVKASGGTDDAGDRWQSLSPKTIAYRQTQVVYAVSGKSGRNVSLERQEKPMRSKAERGRSTRPSQALSDKQQERWWVVYRRALAQYKGNKGHAAAVAWIVLKKEGANTLFNKYSTRRVDILIDSHDLVDSLSPEGESKYRILKVTQDGVEVGTSRPGAMSHHNGIPGRLPQRRLWPHVNNWPSEWWNDLLDIVKSGLVDIAAHLASYGTPHGPMF